MMMAAPEVISMNALLICSFLDKKVLDVGVFTRESSLAAALALPEDGEVVGCQQRVHGHRAGILGGGRSGQQDQPCPGSRLSKTLSSGGPGRGGDIRLRLH